MRTCGMDVLGADVVGVFDFDIASIFKGVGELAQTGVTMYKSEEQSKQSKATDDAKLAAVLAADAAATDASAQALYSADLAASAPEASKPAAQSRANADAALALQMSNSQDLAATGLSSAAADQRTKAANDALTAATKKAVVAAKAYADAPKDLAKKAASEAAQFRVKAAQITAVKAASGQITQTTGRPLSPDEQMKMMAALQARASEAAGAGQGSFLTQRVGPLPVWGWGATVLGLIAAIFGVKRLAG